MKRSLLIVWIFLLVSLGLDTYFVDAQTYTAREVRSKATRQVPIEVGKRFRDLIPGADSTSLEWLWVDSLYIVDYTKGYQSGTVKFEAEGRLRSYSRVVNIDTLPVAARRRIAKEMWKQEKLHPTSFALVEAYYDCESGPCRIIEWSVLFFKSYEDVEKGLTASVFSRSISSNGRLIHRRRYPHFRF